MLYIYLLPQTSQVTGVWFPSQCTKRWLHRGGAWLHCKGGTQVSQVRSELMRVSSARQLFLEGSRSCCPRNKPMHPSLLSSSHYYFSNHWEKKHPLGNGNQRSYWKRKCWGQEKEPDFPQAEIVHAGEEEDGHGGGEQRRRRPQQQLCNLEEEPVRQEWIQPEIAR